MRLRCQTPSPMHSHPDMVIDKKYLSMVDEPGPVSLQVTTVRMPFIVLQRSTRMISDLRFVTLHPNPWANSLYWLKYIFTCCPTGQRLRSRFPIPIPIPIPAAPGQPGIAEEIR